MAKDNIGGKLQGIGLDAFLQMAQMEEITCTLSVTSGDRRGVLFIQEGKLISAETEGMSPRDAACCIVSWEGAVIEIAESCAKTADDIRLPLMNVLMEAMRLRDDAKSNPPPPRMENEEPFLTLELEDSDGTESPATLPASDPSEKATPAAPLPVAPIRKADPEHDTPPPVGEKPVTSKAKVAPSPKTDVPADAPPSRRLFGKPLVIGVIILLAVGGIAAIFLSSGKQDRTAYETLVSKVESAATAEQKLRLLNAYVQENPAEKYSTEANRQIETLLTQKAEQEFKNAEATASRLVAEGDLAAAAAVYETFIGQNKDSRSNGSAQSALKAISRQMEDSAFEEMKATALTQGAECISTYQAFLEKYPAGSHREEVLSLIASLEDEYFVYLERLIRENEASENWEKCLELGRQFLDTYPESGHAENITALMAGYQKKSQVIQTFDGLRKQAQLLAATPAAALAVYSDYLKAHPDSPIRGSVEQELKRLSSLFEQERLTQAAALMTRKLAATGTRFVVLKNETVRDTETGLTWCLLDSQAVASKCLSYEEATSYVKALKTGGHDDWRMPTSGELSALYHKQSPFPSDPEQWYWSSENQKRYTGQWVITVKVVDPARGTEALTKESWQCGAVRAVRRK